MSDEELQELKTQFLVHEKECAERWKTTFNKLDDIDSRLDRVFNLIMAGGATTIMFLLGLISTIIINNW
tara:strand:+ start:116 stop:322 length:207 start_codon:yes stop_codon:yes gene_type:complete